MDWISNWIHVLIYTDFKLAIVPEDQVMVIGRNGYKFTTTVTNWSVFEDEEIMSMMIKLIQCLNDALHRIRFQSVSILFSSHLTIIKEECVKRSYWIWKGFNCIRTWHYNKNEMSFANNRIIIMVLNHTRCQYQILIPHLQN